MEPVRGAVTSRSQTLPLTCGAICLLCYSARTALSYADYLQGGSHGLIQMVLLLAATAASLLLAVSWWRSESVIGSRDARRSLSFALSCGVVCALAIPYGSDFWFYIAEGRLAASGTDVYVQDLTAASTAGLPPMKPQATMMYGPAWVWISTGLSRIGAGRLSVEFALYKTLMLAAWLVNLGLVYRALRASPRHQALAMVTLGWLPLSPIMNLAEGHNDIIMIALLTGWLVSRVPAGELMLVGSALIKPATLPIIALSAIDAMLQRSIRAGAVLAGGCLVAAILFVGLWHQGALIAGVGVAMRQPRFSPAALAMLFVTYSHVTAFVATIITALWRFLLVGFVAWFGWRHVRQPTWRSLCVWVAATLLATLLAANTVWPWYVVWIVPSLALSLDPLLIALALPLIVLMPFLQIVYRSEYLPNGAATMLLYAATGAVWVITLLRTKRTS